MPVSRESKVAAGLTAVAVGAVVVEKIWEHRRELAQKVHNHLGKEFGDLADETINALEDFKKGWEKAGDTKIEPQRRRSTQKAQRVRIEMNPEDAA